MAEFDDRFYRQLSMAEFRGWCRLAEDLRLNKVVKREGVKVNAYMPVSKGELISKLDSPMGE